MNKVIFPKRVTFKKWLLSMDMDRPIKEQVANLPFNHGVFAAYFQVKGHPISTQYNGADRKGRVLYKNTNSGKTRGQREWMKRLIEKVGAGNTATSKTPSEIYQALCEIEPYLPANSAK